jgi:hypothetical protein
MKKISGIGAVLIAILILGIGGGMQRDSISIGVAISLLAILLPVWVICLIGCEAIK